MQKWATLAGLWLAAAPLAAQPASDNVQRDWLLVAGTESVEPLMSALLGEAVRAKAIPPTRLLVIGDQNSYARFCRGLGAAEPDALVVPRRMPAAAFDACQAAGIGDLIEIRLGQEALVLVAKAGETRLALTSHQLYRALAAEVPADDRMVTNTVRTWRNVDGRLPDSEIRVFGPADGAARTMVDDLVLQAGCRAEPALQAVHAARARVTKCVTLRADGAFVGLKDTAAAAAAVLAAAPGALGIVGFGDVAAAGGRLVPLSLDGVIPTYQSIVGDEYDFSRALYAYVKRAHLRDARGVGVVRGLRELMTHLTSEQTIGPVGYLAPAGLISLSAKDRVDQRRDVEALKGFAP